MRKLIEYIVSFSPAEKKDYGFVVAVSNLTRGDKHAITASSIPDLEKEVRKLAHEFGQDCCPYIRLKDRSARLPFGFKAWAESGPMQFIAFVPPPGPQVGDRAICEQCGAEIEFVLGVWLDRDSGARCAPDRTAAHAPKRREG
jgi:hypothetical protein